MTDLALASGAAARIDLISMPRRRKTREEIKAMDDFHFDEVARSLAGGGETRRGLLRLVAGGVLGGVTSRLGLAAGAEAKSSKHRRQRQGAANRNEALQAEGKRKKKHKKRKPQLCDPYCEEEGGRCCPGAGCVFDEQCCPGEKTCGNGSCVGLRACCPDEPPCGDGSCPAPGRCCPEKYQCADGSCVDPLDQCCPDQKRCGNGECVARDECCPDASRPPCSSQCGDVACDEGELVCRPRENGASCGAGGLTCCRGVCYSTGCGEGRHFNPDNCRCECDEVLECPPGQGFSHATCSCVCNCAGRCCLSGCCKHPGPFGGNYCCLGY
jgi:hypothetical protein